MAESYTSDQVNDLDEPYETVVFRNSTIVYPSELAQRTTVVPAGPVLTPTIGNLNPLTSSIGCSVTEHTNRPRQSVLQEFDPISKSEKKISWKRLEEEWQVLVNPQTIECSEPDRVLISESSRSSSESPPPPIPPRREPHIYDAVSFEDRLSFKGPKLTQQQNLSSPTLINNKLEVHSLPSPTRKPSLKGLRGARSLLEKMTRMTQKAPDLTQSSSDNEAKDLLWWNISGKFQSFHTEIKNGYLSYMDPKTSAAKYLDPLNKLVSISSLTDESDLYCFEVVTSRNRLKSTILAASSLAKKQQWMSHILAQASTLFQELHFCDFERAGKVYMKEGISGDWQTFWVLLKSPREFWRQLVSPSGEKQGNPVLEDLRKVRSISVTHIGDEGGCFLAVEAGSVVVVDWPDHSLYIQADLKRESEAWNKILRSRALYSGTKLDEQQLTSDDVPVLVERCVRFISSHGILSEGIYRKSGVTSKIQRLMEQMRSDAWNVRMSTEDYSEHDVSNVLKRFFRTLPEPLLTNELYSQWIDASVIENRDERVKTLVKLLHSLPRINYQTLKRMLGHLHAVHDQCEKNLMPVGNLASLLGPTLMTVESNCDQASSFSHTGAETDVLIQLIQNYPWLFDVNPEALQQERELAKALERLQLANIPRKVDGGNMIIWVHYGPEANNEMSLTVWPTRTGREVIAEVAQRLIQTDDTNHNKMYVLMEHVCDGALKRPIAFNDPVLPVILHWLEWPEEERKNNRLVFCQDDTFVQIMMHVVTPRSMFVEVQYADPKSKQFRKCPFEFCQARLTFLKDCKNHAVQGRYDFESVTWYLGSDPKRNAPTKWVVTFFEKGVPVKRYKDSPFLGHSVCFASEPEFHQFVMSLISTQFREGLRDFVLLLS